jgi:hypothetical protein
MRRLGTIGNSCAATSVSNCHHYRFLGSHTSSWPLGEGKPILTARASGYACFNIAMHRLANASSAAAKYLTCATSGIQI